MLAFTRAKFYSDLPISLPLTAFSQNKQQKKWTALHLSLSAFETRRKQRDRKERENHRLLLLLNLSFDSILFRVRYCREKEEILAALSSAYDPHRRDCGLVLRWVRKGRPT